MPTTPAVFVGPQENPLLVEAVERGGGTVVALADAEAVVVSGWHGDLPELPDSVTWNAYTPDGELARLTFDAPCFLALYAGGAMKHKNETMQRGGERKAAVEAATTPEEVEAA